MKKRLAFIVKHSLLLKKLFVFCGSLFFKILGLFVYTDKRLVLVVANGGNSFGGSPYEIYQYMKKDDRYKKYNFIWAFNEPQKFENLGLRVVKFDSFRYFITALKAKYWITDINIERSLNFKKKGTKYLNTWHGVALKRIGNDDKNSGHYDSANIDYLCVSGRHDESVYKSALNASENSFLKVGMPRNDELTNSNDKNLDMLKEDIGIPTDKKVILYAPTWRDSNDGGRNFQIDLPVNFKKWEKELGNEYVVLLRAHDRTTKMLNVEFNDFIFDFSKYTKLNELLEITDVLITDYSSIVFDYLLLRKPFICFGYDYDEYKKERGFYFDPEKVYPGGVLKNEEQVLDRLKSKFFDQSEEDFDEMIGRFMNYTNGHATERCVEALFGKK